MMKAAQPRSANNRAASAYGDTSRRSSLVEPEMSAILMVVANVFEQEPLQMPLISHDHVVHLQQIVSCLLPQPLQMIELFIQSLGSPARLGSDSFSNHPPRCRAV